MFKNLKAKYKVFKNKDLTLNSGLSSLNKLYKVEKLSRCLNKCDKVELCTVVIYEDLTCFLFTGYINTTDSSVFVEGKSNVFVNKKKSMNFNFIF